MRGARLPSTEDFYSVSRKEVGLRHLTRVMEAVLCTLKHFILFEFSNVSLAKRF